MSRIGFDRNIHPYQLQLRICPFPDLEGIQNRGGVTLNLQLGKITNYHTDNDQISTNIKDYVASNKELKELYSFFTLNAIDTFEAMTESEKRPYETGYYDWAVLRYLPISEKGQVIDGVRYRIYSSDPINMVVNWMRKVSLFSLDI